jgi:hypothetical protein
MRFFELIGVRDVALFLFPTLIFIIFFILAMSRAYLHRKDSQEREKTVVHQYPEGIEARNSPFPLVLILLIVGFLLWAFLYAFVIGHPGVKI